MARQHPVMQASLWMAGALLSFMGLALGGRELAAELTTFQILFFRSVIGLAVVGIVLWRSGWRQILTRRLGLHALRNVAHYAGQYGWFYGLAYIPLAQVFAIEFTAPIWTAVLATIFLNERMTRWRALAVALGMAGLLVILRPWGTTLHPAALIVLAAAVAFAFSHVFTKKLAHTDTPLAVLFYMTAMQLPMGLVPALSAWATPSPAMWPWLLVVGVTALTAHYCLTHAFALVDATVVIPMDFLRLPLIALVGVLFYREPLEWPVLAGGALMLWGNLINIGAERRRETAVADWPLEIGD